MSLATMVDALKLHPRDNVAIATRPLDAGARVAAGGSTGNGQSAAGAVELTTAIGMGHKIALARIASGDPVIRYGQTIGFATKAINPGDWVHTHNLSAGQFERDYAFASEVPEPPATRDGYTFAGYRRADGRVGTRNYIAVISSVNCSASVSKYISARFDRSILADYPNVDGIIALTHKSGCGMQYDGEDHHQLNRVLAGFARHPNVAAFLLVGLGCETGQITHLLRDQSLVQLSPNKPGPNNASQPPILTMQETGGTSKTVEAGIEAVVSLLPRVNDVRRETFPASEIVLGLNCGGSDGNSGVTANPALGAASDLLVAAGATSVLTETPEVYGAEHLLTRRSVSREVGEKLIERIHWWERYAGAFGVVLDNNPSPGNKAGGLTTIYEKSLGAVAKGGSTALRGVYLYGEPIHERGLVFMDSPGFDPASITGLVASGSNVLCFTTGRGSCFGCKPVPSIKIATNTPMYERMIDDMDINAGVILEGTSVMEVGQQIFDFILEVASGRKTKSEQHGIGEEEFVPWSIGPML